MGRPVCHRGGGPPPLPSSGNEDANQPSPSKCDEFMTACADSIQLLLVMLPTSSLLRCSSSGGSQNIPHKLAVLVATWMFALGIWRCGLFFTAAMLLWCS